MRSCLTNPRCITLGVLSLGLLVASCSNASSQSSTSSTIHVSGVDCSAATAQYRTISKAESQLGNNSAMTPALYANRVAQIAQASVWLAEHAVGVSMNTRNFWKTQNLTMSHQISTAAKNGTSTDELIQFSSTALSPAFNHDGERIINFYAAACPGFSKA